MVENIFLSLFKNITRLQRLPVKRYTWSIEMKVLELNCEIHEFIKKYEDNN